MKYNPLKNGGVIIENPNFHEYTITFKDDDYVYDINDEHNRIKTIDWIIEEEYIQHFRQEEIENNETILQSVRYKKIEDNRNILQIKFSGPKPTSEIIDWIDQKIDRLMKKVAKFSMYI